MISVVMPAYNSQKYIQKAIESIRTQTYETFEFIIVDDGSTDDTYKIANHYQQEDARIKVISSGHGGPANALNRGIKEARGEWIAIMHADDIALPRRLEKQVAAAQANPDVVVWGTYAYHLSPDEKILGLSRVGPVSIDEFTRLRQDGSIVFVIHPTAMLRKDCWEKSGGYISQFDGTEDLELFDRMAELGPVLAIPEPLLLYRIHASSVTMQKFSDMRIMSRFVRARQRARLQGLPSLTFEDFLQDYNNVSARRRITRRIDDQAQYYYRKFAVTVAERRYFKSALYLFAAMALNPKYSVVRVWNQRFSRIARGHLRQSGT